MPELPEVEIARRNLARWLAGAKVVGTQADVRARTFRGADPRAFLALRGRLLRADRRGKYLLLHFERGQGLLSHLGMSGRWVKRPRGETPSHSRARLLLDDGKVLHFVDPRLFGRLEPAPSQRLTELQAIRTLGPDPLLDGLTPARLRERIAPSRQALKVALMDQCRLAGLGNIHAAEALFRAGLHPARMPGSLSDAEWRTLARAILATLRYGLKVSDSEELTYVEEPGSENPFKIYGRAGDPCQKCGTPVRAITQGGRTTHFCPRCQPSGRKPKR